MPDSCYVRVHRDGRDDVAKRLREFGPHGNHWQENLMNLLEEIPLNPGQRLDIASAQQTVSRQWKTVLLAEDGDGLRCVMQGTLTAMGYWCSRALMLNPLPQLFASNQP